MTVEFMVIAIVFGIVFYIVRGITLGVLPVVIAVGVIYYFISRTGGKLSNLSPGQILAGVVFGLLFYFLSSEIVGKK